MYLIGCHKMLSADAIWRPFYLAQNTGVIDKYDMNYIPNDLEMAESVEKASLGFADAEFHDNDTNIRNDYAENKEQPCWNS